MLQERGKPSSDAGGRTRRSFADADFELAVSFEPDGSVYGFTLMFVQGTAVHALRWTPIEEYRFFRVKAESRGLPDLDDERNMTDVGTESFDAAEVQWRLGPASSCLEPEVRSFVLDKVSRAAAEGPWCRYCIERRSSAWRCARCRLRACAECLEAKRLRVAACVGAPGGPAGGLHQWAGPG